MKRLNGMDALLLYSETPNIHTHTLKVAVIDASNYEGEYGFENFRRTVEKRLHLLTPLRYKLVGIPLRLHRPMWLENCDVDLDYHLRRVSLPSPGGRRELDEAVGRIASQPLDRRYPLWEFHFVDGMANQRFAVIGKIHHALADGVASANLLALAMDLKGAVDETDDYEVCEPPTTGALLCAAGRDHMLQLAQLPAVIKDIIGGFFRVRQRSRDRGEQPDMARVMRAPPTFLNHTVSPVRTFATTTLELAQVKETAKQLRVTINGLVLAMATGALRQLLLRYDGSAERPIVASVLASTDKSSDRVSGNELSGMAISLPVHIDDPGEWIRLISMASAFAKEDYELIGPELWGRVTAYVPSTLAPTVIKWLAGRDARNRVMNLPISNVAGPREQGHFDKVPVTEIYSAGPLTPGCALNITVWSYVDQLNISLIADDRTFDDTHEATDAMLEAFAKIRCAAGLSGAIRRVHSALALASATSREVNQGRADYRASP